MSIAGDFESSLYLAPYILEKRSITIMKSCKSIPDRFARRNFGSSVNGISVGWMRDK